MLSEHLRRIALAQVERGRDIASVEPPELDVLVARALSPEDVRRALLKETPLLEARQRLDTAQPTPHRLREEAAAVGLLDATPRELAYRRLYPTLDLGVYCAHHAMGKPSEALLRAMQEHLSHLFHHGIGAWELGGWSSLRDGFRQHVADLLGADLLRGDVAQFTSFSDGLSAILDSGVSGRMVAGEDHFSSARYVHAWWAGRTGSELTEIEGDADGWVPTDRYIEALTPDTEVVSITTAHWRTGRLHDLQRLATAMDAVCNDAILLVDTYPTVGTVPFRIDGLPLRTAVIGGGMKHLHAGTGTGFAWMSHGLLDSLEPHRTGWFAHAEPIRFAPPPLEPARGAGSWQTGAPDLAPMHALVTELDVLSTLAGGSLRSAITAVRERTVGTVASGMRAARKLGLEVVGEEPAERRGPLLPIRVTYGEPLVAALAEQCITVDYRPDHPGASTGIVRLSTSAGAFPYELLFAVERLAAAVSAR